MYLFLRSIFHRIRLIALRDAFLLDQCQRCGIAHAAILEHTQQALETRTIETADTIAMPQITAPLPLADEGLFDDDSDTRRTMKIHKVWRRSNGGNAEEHIRF